MEMFMGRCSVGSESETCSWPPRNSYALRPSPVDSPTVCSYLSPIRSLRRPKASKSPTGFAWLAASHRLKSLRGTHGGCSCSPESDPTANVTVVGVLEACRPFKHRQRRFRATVKIRTCTKLLRSSVMPPFRRIVIVL